MCHELSLTHILYIYPLICDIITFHHLMALCDLKQWVNTVKYEISHFTSMLMSLYSAFIWESAGIVYRSYQHIAINTNKTTHSDLHLLRTCWCACAVNTHGHEGRLGLQHARCYANVLVVKGDHVEADGLRHSQHQGQQPDRHDLHRCHLGNAPGLHPWPGCHRSIPGFKVCLLLNVVPGCVNMLIMLIIGFI